MKTKDTIKDAEFKKLFEILPDAVVLIDTQTKLPVMYNEVAYTQLGYTKEEFAKLTIFNYEAIEKPEETEQHIKNIIKNGRDDFETQHKTKQGILLDIKVTVILHIIAEVPHFLCVFRDITEQKKVEKKLKKSEERLDVATSSSNIGVWEYDVPTNTLIWNDEMYKIYGIQKDSFAGAYEAWVSALHPDDLKNSTELFAQALKSKEVKFAPEFRIIWPDGTVRKIKANSKVIRNKNEEALRIIGVNFDITKQKETQEQYLASEAKFRGLFELSPIGIAMNDYETGEFLEFNKATNEPAGYTPEEFEKLNYFDLTPIEYMEDEKLQLESMEETGYYGPYEKRYIRKDGSTYPVLLHGFKTYTSEGRAVIWSIIQDITEQKAIEQTLKHSEQRFSDVADASGEYIWELNKNGEYIFLTKPFEDMMGYTTEESLGKTPFSFMPKEEEIRVGEYFMNEVTTKGVAFRGLIHRSITKDGETIWQKVNGLPMFDNDGNIIGYRGAALDITSEKKATQELETAKAKAEEASSAKTQFLANMSHEIRTPMNAIIGLGDILDEMLESPKQKNMLHKINTSSKMLLAIINDILDYSKIEAGKLELEYKEFRLEDILSQLKVMFEQKASQKGLELYFYPKWEFVGYLLGDQLRLTQVLTNLLSNAIKFTQEGNIVVTIELQEKDENVVVDFSVEDSGIGMSSEQVKRLFQPFSQADSSTTRKYGGTGLGLVISKNIINAMSGDMKVKSREGMGTKFSFSLEFELHSCEIKKGTKTPLAKALIVDDQQISREVLKNMLDRFEYSYDEACDGFEAIDRVKTSDTQNTPYDILLIDWNMPNLNGVDTIKKLHEMLEKKELTHKIPTIFMVSGYCKEDIELESIDIDSFISKPVTPSDLFDAISDAKGGKSERVPFKKDQTKQQFTNTHILIVEDNAINQEVISLMLEKVEITYELAKNGQEGVEKFFNSDKKFDLILMDIQMPIMGGYEATKKIRETNKDIPIVALTAAAMVEDKQKAFEAGMDEHIGKPIDKNELYETISKLTSLTIKPQKLQKTTKKLNQVLDKKYLQDTMGSKERANTMLLTFKNQLTTKEFDNIEELVAKNSKDAHTKVHTLKGVSGNLGAFELCEVLTYIDKKYKKQDTITKEDIQNLKVAKQRLLKELEKIEETKNSNQNRDLLTNDEVHTLFATIQNSLVQGLKVEDEKIEILYENLKQRVDKSKLDNWKEYIEDFDFDEALELMQGWDI